MFASTSAQTLVVAITTGTSPDAAPATAVVVSADPQDATTIELMRMRLKLLRIQTP